MDHEPVSESAQGLVRIFCKVRGFVARSDSSFGVLNSFASHLLWKPSRKKGGLERISNQRQRFGEAALKASSLPRLSAASPGQMSAILPKCGRSSTSNQERVSDVSRRPNGKPIVGLRCVHRVQATGSRNVT